MPDLLISIITAVYNRADTVGQALQSVAGQTYPAVEMVVQDGGSTDGTLAAIRALPDPRINLQSGRDGGIYDAINRGILRARGEILGLMHSDDYFASPDVLAAVASAFADPTVDAVYGDLDYVSASEPGRVIRQWRSQPFHPSLLARGWMPAHPTLYLRRRVFDARGLYDTSFRISADYDAVLRYFSAPGFRAVHLPQVMVKMRVGGESNRSLGRILLKSREDLRALRANDVGGSLVLLMKNLRKIRQFSIATGDAPPVPKA